MAGIDGNVLQRGVNYATTHDVLVVASAGNNGTDTPEFPAACQGVVAVDATDAAGRRAPFSNYGGWVDVRSLALYRDGQGYWIAASDGGVFDNPVVAMAARSR